MKTWWLILCIVYSALFTSCKDENNPARRITELNTADTFLFEFPNRRGVFDSSFYKNNLLTQKSLGLQMLEKGFDSIQIRLWYGGAMVGQRLVILTNKNKKWNAEISKIITEVRPGFEDTLNVDFWDQYYLERTIEYKTPKSGWNNFIKKLFNLHILSLPDQENIEDFKEESIMDGVGVTVEIATKKVYRLYNLSNPDINK